MRPIITIGTYDGVHLGHQYLLKETIKRAEELSTKAVVITYPSHPLEIVRKHVFPYLLSELETREKLIKRTGATNIHYLNFDDQMAQMTAEVFLRDILIKEFNPKMIIIGYDTHFGKNRHGDADFLKKHSTEYGYEVIELKPLCIEGEIVSSSAIRDFIRNGYVDIAHKNLGYYYSVLGKVVHGKQIGRTLGFPTINVEPKERYKLIPGSGIYFTCTRIRTPQAGIGYYFGATKIGVSPTVKTENIEEIETNLFDFSADVYGYEVETFFIEKIRNEKKFNSINELVEQIKNDVDLAKQKIKSFHDLQAIKEL